MTVVDENWHLWIIFVHLYSANIKLHDYEELDKKWLDSDIDSYENLRIIW